MSLTVSSIHTGLATTANLVAVGIPHCAADLNNDGIVDWFDYLDFVTAFETAAPAADFNSDGFIDFFDYSDFVDDFNNPCNSLTFSKLAAATLFFSPMSLARL